MKGIGDMDEAFDRIAPWDSVGDFARKHLNDLGVNVEAKGLENVPADGACMIVANHPTGWLDGMAIRSLVCDEVRSKVSSLTTFAHAALPGFEDHIIPVYGARKEAEGPSNTELMQQKLEAGEAVMAFPAGAISRKRGVLQDEPWSASFVWASKQANENLVRDENPEVVVVPTTVKAEAADPYYLIQALSESLPKAVPRFYHLRLFHEALKMQGQTMEVEFHPPQIIPEGLNGGTAVRGFANRIKALVEAPIHGQPGLVQWPGLEGVRQKAA